MKNIFLTIVTLCVTQLSFSQVLSGIVLDSETKKNIPYAKVYIPDFQIGTISDSVGKFVFNTSIPPNVSLLVTSSMYESKMVTVNPGELIVVAMERTHLELDEVVQKAAKKAAKDGVAISDEERSKFRRRLQKR